MVCLRTSLLNVISLLLIQPCLASLLTLPPSGPLSDANWVAAIRKGQKLSKLLQSGCYPDDPKPLTHDALLAIGFYPNTDCGRTWPPVFSQASAIDADEMRKFKRTASVKAYWPYCLERQHYTPFISLTVYSAEYSPRNGLITTLSLHKSPLETVYWSSATFAIWSAVTHHTLTSPRSLRYHAHHNITNPFALHLINRIINNKPNEVRTFGADTDALYALLGTQLGAGTVWLLMQHKRQLGFKVVSKVYVFGRNPAHWGIGLGPDVVFEIRDVVAGEEMNVTISDEGIAGHCPSAVEASPEDRAES